MTRGFGDNWGGETARSEQGSNCPTVGAIKKKTQTVKNLEKAQASARTSPRPSEGNWGGVAPFSSGRAESRGHLPAEKNFLQHQKYVIETGTGHVHDRPGEIQRPTAAGAVANDVGRGQEKKIWR